MTHLAIVPLPVGREQELANLWAACNLVASYNPPLDDIAFARAGQESDILVGLRDDRIVASGESWLQDRGVRKVQLLVRPTNTTVVGFYEDLGYERSPVTVLQRWLDGTET